MDHVLGKVFASIIWQEEMILSENKKDFILANGAKGRCSGSDILGYLVSNFTSFSRRAWSL